MKVGPPQEVNNRGAHLNSVSTVDTQFDLRGLVGCVIACSTIWGGLRLTVPHFYRPLKQVVGQRREQEAINITKSMDRMGEDKAEGLLDFSKLTGSATRLPQNGESIFK